MLGLGNGQAQDHLGEPLQAVLAVAQLGCKLLNIVEGPKVFAPQAEAALRLLLIRCIPAKAHQRR